MSKKSLLSFGVVCALAAVPVAAQSLPNYTYQELTYPGAMLWARAINDEGTVVLGTGLQALRWSEGVFSIVEGPQNAASIHPRGITTDGTVAGNWRDSSRIVQYITSRSTRNGVTTVKYETGPAFSAFVSSNGHVATFDHPYLGIYAWARGLTGVSADGRYMTIGGDRQASVIDAASKQSLWTVTSTFTTDLGGVNSFGQAVGDQWLSGGPPYGIFVDVLSQNSARFQLFQNSNGSVRTTDVNDWGWMVGTHYHEGKGIGWVGNGTSFFDVLIPEAEDVYLEGINRNGQIAGVWFDAEWNQHAFIATPAQWTSEPYGPIRFQGYDGPDAYRGRVVLNVGLAGAVPEPASYWMVLVGGLSALCMARRSRARNGAAV